MRGTAQSALIMPSSQGSAADDAATTVENSPEPRRDEPGVFAFLKPLSALARIAFNDTVEKATENIFLSTNIF